MANNTAFQTRKDSSNPSVPVAGYESGTDAIISKVEQLAKVSNTATTSGTGLVQVQHVPIASLIHYLDHQGNLTESYGITVTNTANGTAYYVGSIDPNAGTFIVYSDSGLTTPVTNTGVSYSHYFLAPVVGTLNSDGTIAQEVSLAGSNAIYNGTYTVTGAAAQIDSAGQACSMVTVQNSNNSNGIVLVGGAGSQTMEIPPGGSRDYYVSNVNLIYAKFASGTTTATLNWEAKS